MSDIFISHVEEDASIAIAVGRELETSGYTTWLYERDSLPGPAYLLQTGEAISQSQAFVLIISPDSVVSNQVTAEVVRAHESNIPFLPLLHGISHLDFQESQPVWRQALGAATSIEIFQEDIQDAVRRIVGGLKAMGVEGGGVAIQVAESPQPTAHVPSTSGFVGRQVEMGELTHALDDAFAGRGRMVMLVGEPGIGKTRCAQELAATAQVRGAQVVWGQCHESEGAPPYWIWTQAIRSYIQDKDEAQLRSVMGVGASDIANMIPEIKQALPDLEPSPQLDSPEQARFRLFDSVTTFLKSASQSQPLVVVLDDLQWADRSSLMLLEFMVREIGASRLLVVGTYRDVDISREHPLSQALGMMTREQLFTRVNFSGLSQEEVGDYVKTVSSISPAPGLAEAVYGRTNGNPLFVSEVVRLLEQEGIDDNQNWATAIPEGVRDAIGRRLNRLSEESNQVLTTASVIGREFSLDLLDSLIDWADEDQLLDLLEQALSTHVIEEIPNSLGRYRFSHALIQETLSEEMSATRRIRLHARIAESLERLYGSDAQSHAAEIVYHLAQAEQVLGTDKLLRYSMMAGELALSNYAYEEAEIHFQRVLDAKEGQPVDEETASALYGLSRAQAATGETFQFREAVSNLRSALDFYVEAGDVERAVEVAGHPIHPIVGWHIGLVDLIGKALELVPPDSHEAGRLLARCGLALALETLDYEGAQDAFGRALEIAQRESDARLEMQTLAFGADVDWYHFRFQDSLEKGLRAIELAERVDDLYALVTARFYVARAWDFIGNLEQARLHAAALLSAAKELRDHSWLAWAYWISGTLARLEGDWETAREYNEQGLSVAPRDPTLLCTRGILEFENGNFEEGRAHSARLIELMGHVEPGPNHEYACPALGAPILARISGNLASLALGESSAASVLSSPLAVPYFTVAANVGLSLAAVLKGDASAARIQYDALESVPGVMALYISTDRLLGLLAHTMGEFDKSQAHFEDAVNFSRNAGYRPELAWSLCDYADMLVDRKGATDQYMAKALFDESLSISTELDMGPLKERVESRRAALPA